MGMKISSIATKRKTLPLSQVGNSMRTWLGNVMSQRKYERKETASLLVLILLAVCFSAKHWEHLCGGTWGDRHFEVIVSPKFANGSFIVKKVVTKYWNQPLRKWDSRNEILTYLHILKTGGRALEWAINHSVLVNTGNVLSKKSTGTNHSCKMQCTRGLPKSKHLGMGTDCYGMENILCCFNKPIMCQNTFDWAIVQEGRKKGFKMAPIIVLRNPVQRAISHFYMIREVNATRKMKQQSLNDYFSDLPSMMETRRIWSDGEVSCCCCLFASPHRTI